MSTSVSINSHGSITSVVVTHRSTVRAVNWNLLVILSESVAMSVRIVQKSSLKHFVIARFDTWHQVRRGKRNLFSLSMIVSWISIKRYLSNRNKWVV